MSSFTSYAAWRGISERQTEKYQTSSKSSHIKSSIKVDLFSNWNSFENFVIETWQKKIRCLRTRLLYVFRFLFSVSYLCTHEWWLVSYNSKMLETGTTSNVQKGSLWCFFLFCQNFSEAISTHSTKTLGQITHWSALPSMGQSVIRKFWYLLLREYPEYAKRSLETNFYQFHSVVLILQSRTRWKPWLIIDVVIEKGRDLFIRETRTQYRSNMDKTLMISMQAIKIIDVFNVQISARSMIHWCFVDECLKKNMKVTLKKQWEYR